MDGIEASSPLTRRQLLRTGAGGAAGIAVASAAPNYAAIARGRRKPFARDGKFKWGVSSGLPQTRESTLWTRVGGLERTSRVRLEVASDPDFANVVERRMVKVSRGADYTVHARVRDLRPDREYFYRFETRSSHSRVGRFRTAPPATSNRPVRIGFYSCQSYEAGYYTALRGLAQEPDLDLVICLGDYIYEANYYPGPDDRRDTTGPNGDGEVQRLREYREKYRLYQSDPNLKALHAAHPFIAIWDDHEVEDNYAGDEADATQNDDSLTNYGEPRRVSLLQRRRNGYRAFFEAMPRIDLGRRRIYGGTRIGLADLLFLDTRQYRDRQPCGGELAVPCPDENNPGRTLLGAKQKQWLKQRLERAPKRWKLLANQIMLMSLDGAPGASLNIDGWDGYGAERAELMQHILDRDIHNVVSLVGDIHTFFAGTVTTTGRATGTPAATELVGGSATSLGVKHLFADLEPAGELGPGIRVNNPHISYGEFKSRGYGVLEVSRDEARCTFRAPETTLEKRSPVNDLARFRIPAGRPEVQPA